MTEPLTEGIYLVFQIIDGKPRLVVPPEPLPDDNVKASVSLDFSITVDTLLDPSL